MSILKNASFDWFSSLRDPIWGEINITKVESQIIKTEIFNRLRGIKQLGFTYLAFPGASHTRFEHSIGVMHATDVLLQMIDVEKSTITEKEFITLKSRQILRLVALLHRGGPHHLDRLGADLRWNTPAIMPPPKAVLISCIRQ